MARLIEWQANGLRMHGLDTEGNKLPLVLLHGVMGRASCWEPIMQGLQPTFRCIAIDQRGHGDSDKPTQGYGREDYVADLEQTLDALGLQRVILLGHSTGALNAWVYAARHPERVSALILEDMHATPKGRTYLDDWRAWMEQWPPSFASLDGVRDHFAAFRPSLGDYFAKVYRESPEGWVPVFSREMVLQTLAGNEARSWWPELAQIQCPTLILKGERSDFPLEEARRMADALPNGRLEVIPEAFHTVHADRPEAYLAAVRAFLMQTREGSHVH